jgi:hypothetical protein
MRLYIKRNVAEIERKHALRQYEISFLPYIVTNGGDEVPFERVLKNDDIVTEILFFFVTIGAP